MNAGNTAWWGPFVTPGATILGILIGFGLNWARDAWAEDRRWEREDRLRAEQQGREDQLRAEAQQREDAVWYNRERVEAYTTFVRLANQLVGWNMKREETLTALAMEFETATTRVAILGSLPVRQAADGLWIHTIGLSPVGRRLNLPQDAPAPSNEAFVQQERAFLDAVRNEIGLQDVPRRP